MIRRRLRPGARYFEPFLGGGAVAFALQAPGMVLADACGELIDTYRAIRAEPDRVADDLAVLALCNTRAGYDLVRKWQPKDLAPRAARFVFLNHTSFNGLWRVNRQGVYNVPYGKIAAPRFPTHTELHELAVLLKPCDVNRRDFAETISRADPGQVVYCDPPYVGGFDAYTATGFGEANQRQLACALAAAAARGVHVIATNADTPFVRKLYCWARVRRVRERRAINCDGAGRGGVPCVIITGGPR
jgi:DNA adenine methylase